MVEQNVPDSAHADFLTRFSRAQPVLRRFVLAHVPDFHEAEDTLQRVALVLWSKFAEFDPAMGFEAWVFGVARREVLHSRRSAARSRFVLADAASDGIAGRLLASARQCDERQRFLDRCLDRLPSRMRTAIALRYESGLDSGAAAGRLGVSVNALSVLLCRARRALAECLRRLSGEREREGGRA